MAHLYKEEDLENLTEKQKEAIKLIEQLGSKVMGKSFETFAEYMNTEVISINATRYKTTIEVKSASEDELLGIVFPSILKRILNFYSPDNRSKIILNVLKQCKDGKEDLCIKED